MAEMIDIGKGLVQAALAPALVAAVLLFLVQLLCPARQSPGWAICLIFAAAYCVGSVVTLGSGWTPLPERNWHWLFNLAPLAAIAGAVGGIKPQVKSIVWATLVAMSIAAAWLLTGRRDLWLPRLACVALLSIYFTSLAALLDPLAQRLPAGSYLAMLSLAAAALAALITNYASLTHGQLASVAAGGMAGCALVAWLGKQTNPPRGTALTFAIVAGGWAAVETLFMRELWGLLIIPAAPLALWLCEVGPLKRLQGVAALIAQTICVLFAISAAAVMLRIAIGG